MYLDGPGRVLKKGTYHLNKGTISVEVGKPVSRRELEAMGDTMAQTREMRRRYVEIEKLRD